MSSRRQSGLLLHPSSLPSPYGIGDLGQAAYAFVDFLHETQQSIWQVLPLGPTGFGDSPYQSFSAFAGNPLLISLDLLRNDLLLDAYDFTQLHDFKQDFVDYTLVRDFHWRLLRQAWQRFGKLNNKQVNEQFAAFCQREQAWLDDYALFVAIKKDQHDAAWTDWPAALRDRDPQALAQQKKALADEVELQRFVQFIFDRQWSALKAYANAQGVQILGDLPIFVAGDSADVWAHPQQFLLDERGHPSVVAGVPPDYYSETGQLWGNPLYDWKTMKKDGYAWWKARMRAALRQADRVRLDHFRGFAAFWQIPASAKTAVDGAWVTGPGEAFFKSLKKELGTLPLVAEDLGLITEDVHALRRAISVPGMAVLHFAFGGEADNIYLPHNLDKNCLLYTGTHDNNTTRGWYDEIDEATRHHVRSYLGCDGHDIAWGLIRLAMCSIAQTVMIPVQDLLSLGAAARMNTPSGLQGNWAWRLRPGALDAGLRARLQGITRMYGRCEPQVDRDPESQ